MKKTSKIKLSTLLIVFLLFGQGNIFVEAADWNVPDSNGYFQKWRQGEVKQSGVNTVYPNKVITKDMLDFRWESDYGANQGEPGYWVDVSLNYTIPGTSQTRTFITDIEWELEVTATGSSNRRVELWEVYSGSYVYKDETNNYASRRALYVGMGTNKVTGGSLSSNGVDGLVTNRIPVVSIRSDVPLTSITEFKATLKKIEYITFDVLTEFEVSPEGYLNVSIAYPEVLARVIYTSDGGTQTVFASNANASFSISTVSGDVGSGATRKSTTRKVTWSYQTIPRGSYVTIRPTLKFSYSRVYSGYAINIVNTSVKIVIPDSAYEGKEAAEAAKKAADEAKQIAGQADDKVNRIINDSLAVKDANGNIVIVDGKPKLINIADELKSTKNLINSIENNINKNINDLDEQFNNMDKNFKKEITNLEEKLQEFNQNITTNIHSYLPPSLVKVYGYNNATATTNGNFRVSIDYSNANAYRYKIDERGSWSEWYSLTFHDTTGYINVNGFSSGANTVFVEIRNAEDGPIARGRMTVFAAY